MIQFWYTDVSEISTEKFESELEQSDLPDYQKNEIKSFRLLNDQKLKFYGKQLVKEYCVKSDISFDWSKWKTSTTGKPEFSGLHFNISHSGTIVIVGFSPVPIGVDIEEVKTVDIDDIRPFLHKEEIITLDESAEKLSTFYKIWTRKEAYLKAIGQGIVEGLNKENCLAESPLLFNGVQYTIHSAFVAPNYTFAFSYEDSQNTSLNFTFHKV